MIDALDRGWRLLATCMAFLAFGIGGILLQIVGVPLLYLLFPEPAHRRRAARRLIRHIFWVFVRFMRVMGILRFQFVGAERLSQPGLLIVANHPTLLDVVFLLSVVPEATCIVRAGLSSNPFTRAAVRSAGYICNDWGVELVEECVEALRCGSSLIVFPEGTRTSANQSQKWHRGAANVAIRAGRQLTPVWIECVPLFLRKGEPWWRVTSRRVQYSITVLEDLPVGCERSSQSGDMRAARRLTDQLRKLLTGQVESNAGA